MINKISSLGDLLGKKAEHPLADARGLRQVLADLPTDNAFKALDEITGWLESMAVATDLPLLRVHEAAVQLEGAAQVHLKRLTRDYLHAPRLNRADERRLWSIHYGFFTLLGKAYERCLLGLDAQGKPVEAMKPLIAVNATRCIAALRGTLKWDQFHYGPSAGELWQRMGRALLISEAAGVDSRVIPLGSHGGLSSARQEYLRAMVFRAASMDSLLPLEIELAEYLIAHFLPAFVFTHEAQEDSVYWVDLATPEPPLRLARMPNEARASQRFFKPAAANDAMQALLRELERGADVPPEINLGGQYPARTLIPVLRHLAAYLAPIPPQRKHDRHRVKHRMSVLQGLVNAFVVFSREFGGRPAGLQIESWVVENVSRGGFGALVPNIPAEWLKIGALVAVQPEGGDNWLLGVVRRYHRESDQEARAGIETLSRDACSIEMTPHTASSYAAVAGVPSLLIRDGCELGEVRLLLPVASFDLRERLEFVDQGVRQLLTPVALIERTADYELARYRLSKLA